MEKIKLFLKNHLKILLFELVFIVLYVGVSIWIDKHPIQNVTILSIIFSAEFFVAMIVGIAAVYSWVHHKKISDSEIEDSHYDSNLQLLRNIDDLLEVYKDKGLERDVGLQLQDFIIGLKGEYSKQNASESRYEFLRIYYSFINEKISTDQDNLDEDIYQEDRENDKKVLNTQDSSSAVSHGFLSDEVSIDQDNLDENVYQEDKENDRKVSRTQDNSSAVSYGFLSDKNSPDQDNLGENVYQEGRKSTDVQEIIEDSPIGDIKTEIAKEQRVDKKNIRYSKNYENDAKRDNLKWTTWFTLSENTINNLRDEDRQIFITNVNGKDIKFQILGKDLKAIIKQGKPRKHKRAGRAIYDLFFGQDENGNFVEGRHKIDLQKYNIEIL